MTTDGADQSSLYKGTSICWNNTFAPQRAHLLYGLFYEKNVVERSFSKLKLIKNRQRSSIRNERLNFLANLSIEHDILEADFSDIISNFAFRKSRRVIV